MKKELVEQLAEQAYFETEYDDTQNLPELMVRFAELIVKECAGIADKAEPYKANDLIKQHFGVEE